MDNKIEVYFGVTRLKIKVHSQMANNKNETGVSKGPDNIINLVGPAVNKLDAHHVSKNTWPFKLIITSISEKSLIDQYSIMKLSQIISKEMAGRVKRIVPLKSGSVLLEMKSAETLSDILKFKIVKVGECNCRASVPSQNSTCTGVIKNIPISTDEGELVSGLISPIERQTVISAQRILNKYKNPTMALRITCSGTVLPETLQIRDSFTYFAVEPYSPPPLQCYKCLGYGHRAFKCRGSQACGRCGGNHNPKYCASNQFKCINCGGNHTARFRGCPEYVKADKISMIQRRDNISWTKAVGKYQGDRNRVFTAERYVRDCGDLPSSPLVIERPNAYPQFWGEHIPSSHSPAASASKPVKPTLVKECSSERQIEAGEWEGLTSWHNKNDNANLEVNSPRAEGVKRVLSYAQAATPFYEVENEPQVENSQHGQGGSRTKTNMSTPVKDSRSTPRLCSKILEKQVSVINERSVVDTLSSEKGTIPKAVLDTTSGGTDTTGSTISDGGSEHDVTGEDSEFSVHSSYEGSGLSELSSSPHTPIKVIGKDITVNHREQQTSPSIEPSYKIVLDSNRDFKGEITVNFESLIKKVEDICKTIEKGNLSTKDISNEMALWLCEPKLSEKVEKPKVKGKDEKVWNGQTSGGMLRRMTRHHSMPSQSPARMKLAKAKAKDTRKVQGGNFRKLLGGSKLGL